jgi:transposase InsO family protein
MLEDAHVFGAMHERQAATRYKEKDLELWQRKRLLQKLPTRLGVAFILGTKGRECLGLSRSVTPSPDRALDHIVQRCVLSELRVSHLATFIADNVMSVPGIFIAAKWSPYRSRSVKEVLRRHKSDFLRQNATFMIVTSKPFTLRHFALDPWLEIRDLRDMQAWQDLAVTRAG